MSFVNEVVVFPGAAQASAAPTHFAMTKRFVMSLIGEPGGNEHREDASDGDFGGASAQLPLVLDELLRILGVCEYSCRYAAMMYDLRRIRTCPYNL